MRPGTYIHRLREAFRRNRHRARRRKMHRATFSGLSHLSSRDLNDIGVWRDREWFGTDADY
ncbi:hypothetical protein [Chachezhania antarctica]|uniref:hypothetical protein n=1 Tax=Chachezhania antarctica TaxID=2340860 RepID=UPI0013CF2A53|nr:hypothetical protein [Chachezhania antarctica]